MRDGIAHDGVDAGGRIHLLDSSRPPDWVGKDIARLISALLAKDAAR